LLRVGNDIVDLTHPHAKGKSRDLRFLKRVFLPDEERQILASHEPDTMLWTLWTGKEAAYKVTRKDNPNISSAPRLYKVSLDRIDAISEGVSAPEGEAFFGAVDTPAGTISLRTLLTPDCVHSIGISFPSFDVLRDRVVSDVERLCSPEQTAPADESFHVRNAAKKRLSRCLKVNSDNIEIRRNRSIYGLEPPHVCFRGQPAPIDISLSHDGAFIAYAFTLPS